MGNYQRLLQDHPELAERDDHLSTVLDRVRHVVLQLPPYEAALVAELADAFVQLQGEYRSEVEDNLEQSALVVQFASRCDDLWGLLTEVNSLLQRKFVARTAADERIAVDIACAVKRGLHG